MNSSKPRKRAPRAARPAETMPELGALDRSNAILLDLPMPNSVNTIWRRGRHSTYLNPSYRKWMAEADAALVAQRGNYHWPRIDGYFDAGLIMPMVKRGIFDLDNRIKATLDWAQKAGLILDDKNANRISLEWGHVSYGTRLGVRLWMVPAEPDP
ncbi:RusA family crossover junction endodeoxyribonuclease [Methylobacterium ajmalii]|uniref:RusA family crossover junction endodeoxyribonuclease n=1 Tax=Methylobacterium ajmalii TaxID=2738439 RepID=UPI002F34FE24